MNKGEIKLEKANLVKLDNLEKDFSNNGYNYLKIWELNKEDKEEILTKYIACFNEKAKKSKFIPKKKQLSLYEKQCKERLNKFFIWLNESKYKEILNKKDL